MTPILIHISIPIICTQIADNNTVDIKHTKHINLGKKSIKYNNTVNKK
jgi:hypothetical protein